MNFYDELDVSGAPAWRRVGWRRQIEQAYRFEVAVEVIDSIPGTVLDVGCGVGDLARYVRATGRDREFIGIEPRDSFASEAPHPVHVARFEDTDLSAAVAVAIGTLTGGADPHALLTFLGQSQSFVATVLSAEGLADRPLLAAEHAASAVSHDIRWPGARVHTISSTDLAIVSDGVSLRSRLERFKATVAGPWAGHFDGAERAWLACEIELWEEARRQLADAPDSAFVQLLRDRLALV